MNMMIIMDVVIVFFGVYMAFISIKMMKTGQINSIILAEEEMKKCKKPKAFVKYIAPRMLVFAIVLTVTGIFGILFDTVLSVGNWDKLLLAVFLIAFVIFTVQFRKARENFVS